MGPRRHPQANPFPSETTVKGSAVQPGTAQLAQSDLASREEGVLGDATTRLSLERSNHSSFDYGSWLRVGNGAVHQLYAAGGGRPLFARGESVRLIRIKVAQRKADDLCLSPKQ